MWQTFRRWVVIVSLLVVSVCVASESAEVNLDYVAKLALDRAKHPFHSPRADLPKVLQQDSLDYDKYREIRFRRDRALWASDNLPFRIEFFHPGYLYQEPVHVNEFTLTHVQPIRFVQDFFDYGKLDIANKIPSKTGYAGFWARVISACSAKTSATASRRAGWRWIAAKAGVRRNSRSSPTGGWANRTVTTTKSASLRFSTV